VQIGCNFHDLPSVVRNVHLYLCLSGPGSTEMEFSVLARCTRCSRTSHVSSVRNTSMSMVRLHFMRGGVVERFVMLDMYLSLLSSFTCM